MRKLSVLLAENTYEALAGSAGLEAIDVPQFCSAILTEFADKSRHITYNEHVITSTIEPNGNLPDTVLQVLAVARYVWVDQLDFNEAVHRTAKEFSVQRATVRDKCTRRITLPNSPVETAEFLMLLSKPSSLREHLCQKFPKYSSEISARFSSLPVANAEPQTDRANLNLAIKPAVDITEKHLIEAIVTTLREKGGSAAKSLVEEVVFQKFKSAFEHSYYQKLVGPQVGFPGVPYWRKKIEFARNTAREMGLIQPPEQSGRGIWALTERGRKWTGE